MEFIKIVPQNEYRQHVQNAVDDRHGNGKREPSGRDPKPEQQ